MNSARLSIPWVMLAVFAVTLMLGLYFTFAAVQGDYGLFRRAEILSDAKKLEAELTMLQSEVDRMRNLTWRHIRANTFGRNNNTINKSPKKTSKTE